jgi:ABC-2 type transport system ATP-binding protein
VGAGEVFGFLGPNGAGKTTTVRVLATLIAPSEGSAEVAGIDVGGPDGSELRGRIAVMPESPGLYLRLSVQDNLEFFAGLVGVPQPLVGTRVREALDAVEMGGRAKDLAGSLSKGLRQRTALARTLLGDPRILFLDEPTSGLDPVAGREVRELIDGLRSRGVTVFLTTHRLEEAERLCDRVAILNTTLRVIGRPDELRRSLFSQEVDVRVARPLADPARLFQALAGVRSWSGRDGAYRLVVDEPAAVLPALTRALVAEGSDVLRVAEVERSLEDVYLQLIQEDVEVRS